MPTKRQSKRVKADEADEERAVALDKENEMNRGGRSKRGKRKPAPDSDEEEVDEAGANDDDYEQNNDEEEEEEEEEQLEPASPPPNPKRSKKKGGNRAAVAINSPMKDRHTNPTGKPAEAGIIHEVYVENFMCHRKLSVKLCRNVNFIHGQNGSGKSAILAAIQVCLGAGARRTHRARNLKDLVRKEAGADCSGAKLRVTLLNKGADGYMPDVYGETITVERVISLRSGGFNGYKLLDQNMKERSRSKKDLDAMLDQLNIQVENPVAVLDQEEAKKFLMGKAEDKYAFFTKATELERLDRSYAAIQDNIFEQKETEIRARENLGGTIENAKRLKKEWEQFQELDKLELEAQEMRTMYGWSLHSELEGGLREDMKKAQKFAKALEKYRAAYATAEQSVNVTDDQETELNKQLAEYSEEANEAAEARTELENELKAMQAPIKQKERDQSLLARELAQEKKKHKGALRRLENARKQILETQGTAKEEERQRTRKIAQTEADLAKAKERVDPLKADIAKHLSAYQDVEPSVNQAKETREGTERQLHAVQQRVRQLQQESGGGGGSNAALFGNKCKALYEAVQKAARANKFTGPVVGPVGLYVKVAPGKEKWAKLAETAIGIGALDRFVVTNQADLKLMNKLRRDVGCGQRDCSLYRIHPRSTENKYDVPAPPPGVELVTSVLQVENAMAFNFLVDHAGIDNSALTDSKELSEQKLLVRDGSGQCSVRGGKVRKVYFFPNGDHWEAKKGKLVMIGNDRGMKQTIGVDRSAAIESTKHEMKALQQELARNKEEEKAIKDAEFKEKKAWNVASKEHAKVTSGIKKMEALLDELRAEAETSEEAPTIDTTEYENDIQEAESAVEDLKKKEAAIAQEIESLQPDLEEKKRQLEETTARNEKIMSDMDKVDAKLEDIVKGQTRRMQEVDKMKAKVENCEEGVKLQEEKVKDAKGNVTDALAAARKMQFDYNRDAKMFELRKDNGGEIPPGQEVALEPTDEDLEEIEAIDPPKDSKHYKTKVQSKLKKIEKEKERRNVSESDPAVARDKYFRAKKDLDSKMEQIDTIERNTKALSKDLHNRRKRWGQFRNHITEMTNLGFDEFLNKKGSAGSVQFDHEGQRLDLTVQKNNADEHSQTKDVKALSGGERSFTTLSLLLAIGEILETPFRVMDEFDVFLDPVARKIAMKTLVDVAKDMDHRQFIFITPQDVSSLKTDPKLRIFKLKPPARNITVGGPQQQTLDFGN